MAPVRPFQITAKITRNDAMSKLLSATCADDVFNPNYKRYELELLARRLRILVHPDNAPADRVEDAKRAFQMIDGLLEQAIKSSDTIATVVSPNRTYELSAVLHKGAIATVYACHDSYVVKIANVPENNDLLQDESELLPKLYALTGEPKLKTFRHYMPTLLETFLIKDPDNVGVLRRVNVFDYDPELLSCEQLLDTRSRTQISPAHGVWLYNRLLSFIEFLAHAGISFANILPQHIMIRPSDHGVVFVDWTAAAADKAKYVVAGHARYYPVYLSRLLSDHPQDVNDPITASLGKLAVPQTDLFMAAQLMNRVARLDDDAYRIIDACTQASIRMQPVSAAAVRDKLMNAAFRRYGPPKWADFHPTEGIVSF